MLLHPYSIGNIITSRVFSESHVGGLEFPNEGDLVGCEGAHGVVAMGIGCGGTGEIDQEGPLRVRESLHDRALRTRLKRTPWRSLPHAHDVVEVELIGHCLRGDLAGAMSSKLTSGMARVLPSAGSTNSTR